jgi:putative ABC transport system permease protein
MNSPSSRPVAIGLRLYRALAKAFPQEFQNVYGDEMLQVAEESIEPIWQRRGAMGLMRLLIDIMVRLPIEYGAEMRQDIRYGLRMLARSPGFTAVALISLSLGICAPASFFSELNGTVLRDLPGTVQPDQLVSLDAPISYPVYRRVSERSNLFSSTLAYVAPVPFGVSVRGRKERIWGHLVTPSYFTALGARPTLGRVFDETYQQPGISPAVVVSYRMWQNQLGSDPEAIGKTLLLNGHPWTVLGVGPKDFLGASPIVLRG